MSDFFRSVGAALDLIGRTDPELLSIVALSLCVGLAAGTIAMVIGVPIGAWLAIVSFRGEQGRRSVGA